MVLTEKEKALIREALAALQEDIEHEKEHCEYVRPGTLKMQISALVTDKLTTCKSILDKIVDAEK